MGLELRFPFEFVVEGTPISSSNSGSSKDEWMKAIRRAYRQALPVGHWAATDPVYVMILHFPDAMMRGDIDNIVKWMIDAMTPTLFVNDRQVERVIVQKFELGRTFHFVDPTSTLAGALEMTRPVTYVRIDDDNSVQDLWSR